MAWTIGYHRVNDPLLVDDFFATLGRALYIAVEFESKCRHVLRIGRIVEHYEATGDSSAAFALVRSMKDKTLGPTISQLAHFTIAEGDEIAILERAKDARNYIAHEVAQLGMLSEIRPQSIHDALSRLRDEVTHLAAGDNIVSRWLYEIGEKEPAPSYIQREYHDMVQRWVFDGSQP